MTEIIEMEINVKGKLVFIYTRFPGDFDLNDITVTIYIKDTGNRKIIGVK